MLSLFHFVQYLIRKIVLAAVIGVFAIVTYATWLFLQDGTDFETSREVQLQHLNDEISTLNAKREPLSHRVATTRTELQAQQLRVDRAARVITLLVPLQSRWARWFGDAAEQDRIGAQIEKMRNIEETSRSRVLILQSAATKAEWELNGVETQLSQVQAELGAVRRIQSWKWHYLIDAWYRSRWFLLAALIVYFIGGPLRRVGFFIFVSPLLANGKPLRFGGRDWDVAEVEENAETIEVALWPGERLCVRRQFTRSGDIGLAQRSRFFLNARFPFMCLFGGLTRLIELHHRHARAARAVTLTANPDRELDFAMFNIPEGGSLMLRARYLAGVVLPPGQKLRVRSRWRLLDRHAWAAGQLRFMEFCGPCRLIVASPRALRVSHVPAAEAPKKPSRVAERRRVIGFSPSLEFGQVRQAHFWRYVFSGKELLDGRFVGAGLMLSEEPPERLRRRSRPFIRGMWNNVIDAFGY